MRATDVVQGVLNVQRFACVTDVISYLIISGFRDDSDAQAECLRVLAKMCFKNAENARRAGEHGAIPLLVGAMKRYRACREVQENGCQALISMCRSDGENKRRACERGAVRAVVDTMGHHRDDKKVQQVACGALMNVCFGDTENERHAGENGAITFVIEAMTRYLGSAKVQAYGCGALMNMCSSRVVNKRLASRHGAIRAVLNAMTEHHGNDEIQRKGCGCLINICSENLLNKAQAFYYGAYEQSLEIMERFTALDGCTLCPCAILSPSESEPESESAFKSELITLLEEFSDTPLKKLAISFATYVNAPEILHAIARARRERDDVQTQNTLTAPQRTDDAPPRPPVNRKLVWDSPPQSTRV